MKLMQAIIIALIYVQTEDQGYVNHEVKQRSIVLEFEDQGA